jgi:heat shock protein HslJ
VDVARFVLMNTAPLVDGRVASMQHAREDGGMPAGAIRRTSQVCGSIASSGFGGHALPMRHTIRTLAIAASGTLVFVAAGVHADLKTPGSVAGTRWQLVKIIGLDDQLTLPDEPARYTIEFDAGGRASLRVDCNRVMTTWTSAGAGRVQFGVLAGTRANCAGNSLAGRVMRELPAIRTYSIRDMHLYLAALDETAAIWEFEPLRE